MPKTDLPSIPGTSYGLITPHPTHTHTHIQSQVWKPKLKATFPLNVSFLSKDLRDTDEMVC